MALSSKASSRAALMHVVTATVARRCHGMMMSTLCKSHLAYVIAPLCALVPWEWMLARDCSSCWQSVKYISGVFAVLCVNAALTLRYRCVNSACSSRRRPQCCQCLRSSHRRVLCSPVNAVLTLHYCSSRRRPQCCQCFRSSHRRALCSLLLKLAARLIYTRRPPLL